MNLFAGVGGWTAHMRASPMVRDVQSSSAHPTVIRRRKETDGNTGGVLQPNRENQRRQRFASQDLMQPLAGDADLTGPVRVGQPRTSQEGVHGVVE